MREYQYTTTKSFDNSGPNQGGAITVYYKMPRAEITKLKLWVDEVEEMFEIESKQDPYLYKALTEGIKGHKRQNGTYYTTMDIIRDLQRQLAKGKDPTKSMVSRWNDAAKQLKITSVFGIKMVEI